MEEKKHFHINDGSDHTGHIHKNGICEHFGSSVATQSVEELDFQRGLWPAALNGDLNKILKLLESGRLINEKDKMGYSPLHYACRNGKLQACQLLLSKGALVNAQTHSGATPLHRAAFSGHSEVVSLLLLNGANSSLQDDEGMTAGHKAAEQSQVQVIQTFLECEKKLVRSSNSNTSTLWINIRDKQNRLPVDCVPQHSKDFSSLTYLLNNYKSLLHTQ